MKKRERKLVLTPDIFLWKTEEEALFYNTVSHQSYLFPNTGLVSLYCDKLSDINNLYVVDIAEEDWEDNMLHDWLHEIVNREMGFFCEKSEDEPHIISFPPLLNLQSDIDRIEVAEDRSVGEYAAQNWNEFSIYLGGQSGYPELYKQVPYPVNDNSILEFDDLRRFFSSANHSYLNTINVIGDLFSYPYRQELMDLLYSIPIKKNLYMTTPCVNESMEQIEQLDMPNCELYIFYESKMKSNVIHKTFIEKAIPFRWIYLISKEEQSEELERLEARYGNECIELHPIYTGDNLSFFENNIYMTEEEILQSHYDKQDIFAHQVMNTNFWGRLSVLPDGRVYSNLNHLPIGTLKDRVYDLIVDEMKSKRSWRWIRDDMLPCKNCLYRYLCPSPSNYEIVTGKTNLCYVKPN